jgi:hypothetical protein
MKLLYIHGWMSKPAYLAKHGHVVTNLQLPDDDFPESVLIAEAEFDKHQPEVFVGSSRGKTGACTAWTIGAST